LLEDEEYCYDVAACERDRGMEEVDKLMFFFWV